MMKSMVDIEVVIDDAFIEPQVTIRTREKTEQIENIICAIENVSENDFPMIPAYLDDKMEFLSQREIIRTYTQGRKVIVETQAGNGTVAYTVRKTMFALEEELNSRRFLRISRSEIINLYKVKRFDIGLMGTIGVEFENGTKSWVARSRVKMVKEMLKA